MSDDADESSGGKKASAEGGGDAVAGESADSDDDDDDDDDDGMQDAQPRPAKVIAGEVIKQWQTKTRSKGFPSLFTSTRYCISVWNVSCEFITYR